MLLLICLLSVGQDPLFQTTSKLDVKLVAQAVDNREIRDREAYLVADPNDARRFIGVSTAYADVDAFRQAIDVVTYGIARLGKRPELLRERGRRRISLRLFHDAIDDLVNASQLDPRDHWVLFYLGLARYFAGDWTGALAAHERGLQVATNERDQARFHHWIWWAYQHLGKEADAARVLPLKGPVSKDPTVLEELLRLRKGTTSVAALRASSLYKADPTLIEYGIGQWHLHKGSTRDAEQAFKRALERPQWGNFGYVATEVWLARSAEARPIRGK